MGLFSVLFQVKLRLAKPPSIQPSDSVSERQGPHVFSLRGRLAASASVFNFSREHSFSTSFRSQLRLLMSLVRSAITDRVCQAICDSTRCGAPQYVSERAKYIEPRYSLKGLREEIFKSVVRPLGDAGWQARKPSIP